MINNPFIHSLSFHCCVQLRMSNAVYTAMVRWKKGDSLIKTYRGPNIGSRLRNITLLPSYQLITALSLRRAIALSSSRHLIIASSHCSIFSLSTHSSIIALRTQTSIVQWCDCELPSPMWNLILIASYQKFAFLLPERYFFNDLNFPVFENCYSFYFFLFSYFVTIVCSQSAK